LIGIAHIIDLPGLSVGIQPKNSSKGINCINQVKLIEKFFLFLCLFIAPNGNNPLL